MKKETKDSMLDKIKTFLDSPEGLARAKAYFGKIADDEAVEERWVRKFAKRIESENDLDSLFQKFDKHYEKRRDILFEQRIDGYSSLCKIVLGALREIGEDCMYDLHEAYFTVEAYEYKGYIAEYMIGQGSAYFIYKKKIDE